MNAMSPEEQLRIMAAIFRMNGGNVDKGWARVGPANSAPGISGGDMGVDLTVPAFAQGTVTDHPQLAMIGEAGPEVVLPLTRRAADPRLQSMQDRLGLPAQPMATGGMAGMGGGATGMGVSSFGGQRPDWMQQSFNQRGGLSGMGGLQQQMLRQQGNPLSMGPSPAPWSPGRVGSPGLQGGGFAGSQGSGSTAFQTYLPWTMSPEWQNASSPLGRVGSNPLQSGPMPAPGGSGNVLRSGPAPAPGGGGAMPFGNDMIAKPLSPTPAPDPRAPGGPRISPPGRVGGPGLTSGPGQPQQTTMPAPAPGAPPSDPRFRGTGQAAYNAWAGQTGNEQGLSFEDWMKPGQANWFKDQWANRQQGQGGNPVSFGPTPAPSPGGSGPGFTTRPAPAPGGTQVAPVPGGNPLNPRPQPAPGQPPQPPMGMPGQGGGGQPQSSPFGPTSAMDVYRSAVPVMNQAMDDAISSSTASAGLTGTRFGTATQNNAMDIARRGALEQNQLMGQLLYGQTQADQDRALQATGMGLEDSRFRNQLAFQGGQNALDRAMRAAGMGQSGAALEHQMQQDKLQLPFQIGAWEQGRQDQYARLPYDEFMRDRDGYLPEIMNLIGGTGGTSGMSGQWGTQQTGGSPGFIDYFSAFAPYLGLFMAEGGAAGYGANRALGGY